jgi:glycosyltransferase involved in cell wall biosynthesis
MKVGKASAESPVILIISHVNPLLHSAGNEIRILKMIKWLRAKGFKVVLLLNHDPLSMEIRKQFLEIVDAVYTPDECPVPIFPRIIRAAKRLFLQQAAPVTESEKVRFYLCPPSLIYASGVLYKRYRLQAVIAEYVFTTPCLRKVPPGLLKMVDTHDLLSKRDPKESIYCSPQEERAYLLNADVIIAIQESEAEQFRDLVPERKVVTVGIDYDVLIHGVVENVYKNTVLVVGSKNPGNISGLNGFCEYAWPLVCKKIPRAELLVVGKIGEALSLRVPQVRVLGWVDNIEILYRQAAVVINPTMYGTGLKIKTAEALSNGKPLVTTPNAVEGLVFSGKPPCMVCYNWPEFAEAIISLFESDERRLALQESAIRFAREHFAGSRVYAQMEAILQQ